MGNVEASSLGNTLPWGEPLQRQTATYCQKNETENSHTGFLRAALQKSMPHMKQLCLAHHAIHTSQHQNKPVSENIIFFSPTDMFVLHPGKKKIKKKNQKQMMKWKPFSYRYAAGFQFPFVENPFSLPSSPLKYAQLNSQQISTDQDALSTDKEGQLKEASSANWSKGSMPQVAEYQIMQMRDVHSFHLAGQEGKQKPPSLPPGFAGSKHSSPRWQTKALTRTGGQAINSAGCPQGMAYFKPACKHLSVYVLLFHGRII